jgi:hypothetical protein
MLLDVDDDSREMTVHFQLGTTYSTAFTVFTETVIDFDQINLSFSVSGVLSAIDGLSFRWTHPRAAAVRHLASSRMSLSVFLFYVCVHYVLHSFFEKDKFTQVFCLLVAGIGSLTFNPVSLFSQWSSPTCPADYIILGAYVSLLRLFEIVELEIARSGQNRPGLLFLLVAGLLFACYGTIESSVTHGQALLLTGQEIDQSDLSRRRSVLLTCHCAYGVCFGLWSLAGLCPGKVTKRASVMTIFGLLQLGSTLLVQIACWEKGFLAKTIVPLQLFRVSHALGGGFTIYLMRPSGAGHCRSSATLTSSEEEEGFPENDTCIY